MKLTEPRAMAEIHEIRERIHAEKERLGVKEYDRIARQKVLAMLKQYGMDIPIISVEEIRNRGRKTIPIFG